MHTRSYCITNSAAFIEFCELLTKYNIAFTSDSEENEVYSSNHSYEELWEDLTSESNRSKVEKKYLQYWPFVVLEVDLRNDEDCYCVHFHVPTPNVICYFVIHGVVYGCDFYDNGCSDHYYISSIKSEEPELSNYLNALKAQIHDSLTMSKNIVQKSFSKCSEIVDLFTKYGFTHRKIGDRYSGTLLSRGSFIKVANLQWQDSDDLCRAVDFHVYAGPAIREVYISRTSNMELKELRHFGYLVDIEDVEKIDKYLRALLNKPFFNIGFENVPPNKKEEKITNIQLLTKDEVAHSLEDSFRALMLE